VAGFAAAAPGGGENEAKACDADGGAGGAATGVAASAAETVAESDDAALGLADTGEAVTGGAPR
jgi:hypothetical protein